MRDIYSIFNRSHKSDLTLDGTVVGNPYIYAAVPTSLTGFNYGSGTGPSNVQSFAVNALYLTEHFESSLDNHCS
jgi:hypothetical protein